MFFVPFRNPPVAPLPKAASLTKPADRTSPLSAELIGLRGPETKLLSSGTLFLSDHILSPPLSPNFTTLEEDTHVPSVRQHNVDPQQSLLISLFRQRRTFFDRRLHFRYRQSGLHKGSCYRSFDT